MERETADGGNRDKAKERRVGSTGRGRNEEGEGDWADESMWISWMETQPIGSVHFCLSDQLSPWDVASVNRGHEFETIDSMATRDCKMNLQPNRKQMLSSIFDCNRVFILAAIRTWGLMTRNMKFSKEVSDALRHGSPVVALESTIICHGASLHLASNDSFESCLLGGR